MPHDHAHSHAAPPGTAHRKMGAAVALTLAFVAAEAIAGFWSHSLALVSDAGHNFADAAALAFSWYALWIARKPAHQGMTYGYHRVGILAALVNALSLVVIALLIVWEAIDRLRRPPEVNGPVMIVVAAIAIGVNLLISYWLRAGAKRDINVRSAYVHMMGDAASALAVVVAGAIVATTGWRTSDPVVSLLIAALILWSSWGILKESTNAVLEGTPFGLDMPALERCIASVSGVLGVHDLHVWTVGPGAIACSCHILVADQTIREGQQILIAVVRELEQCHGINHATIQIEVEKGCCHDLYCSIETAKQPDAAGHSH